MTLRLPFASPELRDEVLSTYLDGELDLADHLDLETWLSGHAEDRARLAQFQGVVSEVQVLGKAATEVPLGWTLRAYRLGVPAKTLSAQPTGVWVQETLALRHNRPTVVGHSRVGAWKRVRSRRWVVLWGRT